MTDDQVTALRFLISGLIVLALLYRASTHVRRARSVVDQPAPTGRRPRPGLSQVEIEARRLQPTDMDTAIRLLTERHYAQPVTDIEIPRPRTGEDHQ